MKYALVTLVNENFLKGAEVMLHSFMSHNKWFKGDIIIINNRVSESSKRRFHHYKKIKFININNELKSKISVLKKSKPSISDIYGRFYSIQVFSLDKYDKVLFVDSDTLIIKSLQNLFDLDLDFSCTRDCSYLKNMVRDFDTYDQIKHSEILNNRIIKEPFNSGVMLISKKYLNKQTFKNMLNLLTPKIFKKIQNVRPADEIILNYYFENNVNFLDSKFNYLILLDKLIYEKEKIMYHEASIIHYAGKFKPWLAHDNLKIIEFTPRVYKYLELWYDYYLDLRNK